MTNGSRRSHAKSRNGCGQCKRRHVKCNLQAPICYNCWKRDVSCDYQSLSPASCSHPNPTDGPDKPQVFCRNISALQRVEPHASRIGLQFASSNLNGVSMRPIDEHPALHGQLLDPVFVSPQNMELMKHFAERTCFDIDLVLDGDLIWQREAVQASAYFPFLQHALMALSALHIFRKNPLDARSYYSSACWHSMRASELFRASVYTIDQDNWQPVLIFLIASIIFSLDIRVLDQVIDYATHAAISPASILLLMRYPGSLSQQLISRLVSGSLASTLLRRRRGFRVPIDEQVICAIKSLDEFCAAEMSSGSDAETYNDAVKSLKLWAESVSCQPQSWHGLVEWPVTVSDKYIQLLDSGDGFAAVIFCYWCAVMNRAPKRYYLAGVMKKLEGAATTRLNGEWEALLQWPRKELQKS